MNVFLFIPFYIDSSEDRNKELLYCLKKNIANFVFDKIILISEQENNIFKHPKLQFVKVPVRPTYNDVFFLAAELNPDGFNFICNSDIFFSPYDTLKSIKLIDENSLDIKLVLALSRWDLDTKGNISHYCKDDSQDSWIYKGKISKKVCGNFHFGKPGCDNRIAYELMLNDYLVINPSKQIQSFHLHNSNVRNYNPADRISPPYYYPIIL